MPQPCAIQQMGQMYPTPTPLFQVHTCMLSMVGSDYELVTSFNWLQYLHVSVNHEADLLSCIRAYQLFRMTDELYKHHYSSKNINAVRNWKHSKHKIIFLSFPLSWLQVWRTSC